MSHYFIDLFCGAGGVTTGISQTDAMVIACVNHDAMAIKSHEINHPECKHYTEDMRILDLTEITDQVKKIRRSDPEATISLWASLECTNFSRAKGGRAREADSRTLAEHLFRYLDEIDPDILWIENVEEFMSWGPLDDNGKPISKKNGTDYIKWCNSIQDYGYGFEYRILNAANYGAFTSRKRYFAQFAKPHIPIVWPEPTHSKKPSSDQFGGLAKWRAVKDVLDFTDEGISIFNRKKPLSDKTLERIYAGLVKYVAKGDRSFISKYYSGKAAGKNIPTSGPAGTVTCVDHHSLVQTKFLASYYGNGDNVSSIESASPTVTTKDRIAIISPEYFIDKHYGTAQNQSIHQPAGSILPTDKHRLVEVTPLNAKHHYLVNPSHGGHSTSIEAPCPVVIARQDKAPLYLIQIDTGEMSVPVYDCDSQICILIKEFMAAFRISDIKMRMLRIIELLLIQGFPEGYFLAGSQADQKKFIGNAVEVNQARILVHTTTEKLKEIRRAA